MTEQEAYSIPENIDAAIDKAAEHLPEGWEINISIERHGYGAVSYTHLTLPTIYSV